MTDHHVNASTPAREESARPRPLLAGNTLFFPGATVYAIFVLPASLLSMLGMASALPGLGSPAGHAHEMLFGFALAAVAGNQLGPMATPRLASLFALWAIARVTFLLAPLSLLSGASNIAFAALLAAQIAPRLLRSAKKLRNMALPAVLIAICAGGIASQLAPRFGLAAAEYRVLLASVLLFALLMLFMGGRLIAPAVAGQFYRQGGNLDARVQPRIEGALIACMTVAISTTASTNVVFVTLSAAALLASGLLAGVRLLRWRLWALRARPDLLCLAAGYAWLAAGLLALGAALATGGDQTAALHVITVGSIGTLTLNVMAMTWTLKAQQDPARSRLPVIGTLLIGVATLLRVLAGLGAYDARSLLLIAALCWSGAFALLLARLASVRRRPRK
jgi:uncharacterized protein involved in response to NO